MPPADRAGSGFRRPTTNVWRRSARDGRRSPRRRRRGARAAATAGRACSTASISAASPNARQALDRPQRFHGVPARRAGSRRDGDVRRSDGEHDFGAADAVGRSRSSIASACSTTMHYDVECALDGPPTFAGEGTLWGGNLAMVAHLAGTPLHAATSTGGILFLEDVGEHPVPDRADALPAAPRRHSGATARGAARRLHRVRALERERRRLRSGGSGCAATRTRGEHRSTRGCRSATCPTS